MPDLSRNTARNEDPYWWTEQSGTAARLPFGARHWLLDTGSLTQRLLQASGGQFAVQRLRQDIRVPLPSERHLLQLPHRGRALVREVALRCQDHPWVYARSVIPLGTLTGSLRHLRHLHNQSLGELIFRDPSLGRSPFELSLLRANSRYIHPDLRQDAAAWARRSRFLLRGKPLLVSEVFLEDFQPWPATARACKL